MTNWTTHLMMLGLAVITAFAPELASAASMPPPTTPPPSGFGPIERGLCALLNGLTGPVGGAIAAMACVFLGIGAFFGKVNWGLAIMVGVGIAGIFGAVSIVQTIQAASTQNTAWSGC